MGSLRKGSLRKESLRKDSLRKESMQKKRLRKARLRKGQSFHIVSACIGRSGDFRHSESLKRHARHVHNNCVYTIKTRIGTKTISETYALVIRNQLAKQLGNNLVRRQLAKQLGNDLVRKTISIGKEAISLCKE